MSKKIFIGGRIESAEVGGVVTGANAILDDTKQKKQNVINKETDDELARLENAKQDNLMFDNAPTENSTNPVTSGGVYTADKVLSDAIEVILLLIPSAASALNKLVDMATMNSSISTATATFRGTSAAGLTEEQFLVWANGLTHDLNDYVFWQTVDAAGNTQFKRYKWNGTEWLYEYTLNNSSFTADQWAAIQSGITSALVTKLTNLPNVTELGLLFDAKQNVLTFDEVPEPGSNNPVKSKGVYYAINALAQIVGTINGKIPSEASEENQLADKEYVVSTIAAAILAAICSFKGQFTTLAELENVLSPKAGDLGIVRTKDSDGKDVFMFYQYLSNAWNVFYTLEYHPQVKPATTGTTGDFPYNGMGRVELAMNMVNIGTELVPVMVNQLTQDMFYKTESGARVPNTNTIFVIQYDYVLGEDITVPANCVLEFEGGSIGNASGNTYAISGAILNKVVEQGWFKTVDDFHRFINNVDGPTTYIYSKGRYEATVPINKGVDKTIEVIGNGVELIFEDTDATDEATGNIEGVFYIHPKTSYSPVNISAAIDSGAMQFTVADASGFSIGDVIALKDNATSSFFWSRNYQEGEYVKVQKISGNTIYTSHKIIGNYKNVGSLTALKVDIYDCVIKDLHLIQKAASTLVTRGLFVSHASGFIDNVEVRHFELNLRVSKCWNLAIENCSAFNGIVNYTLDAYALSVNNCQNVRVIGGVFSGTNHGIATGGNYDTYDGIINRFILYKNCETSRSGATSGASIDSHDDTDYLTVDNCKATGIRCGGKHITVKNCWCDYIDIPAANNWEHTVEYNNVDDYIQVGISDASGTYEYSYDNYTHIEEKQQTIISNNICGSLRVLMNGAKSSLFDATLLSTKISRNTVSLNVRLLGVTNSTTYTGAELLKNCGSTITFDNNIVEYNYNGSLAIEGKDVTLLNNKWRQNNGSLNISADKILIQGNDFTKDDALREDFFGVRNYSELKVVNNNMYCLGHNVDYNEAGLVYYFSGNNIKNDDASKHSFYIPLVNNGKYVIVNNTIDRSVNTTDFYPSGSSITNYDIKVSGNKLADGSGLTAHNSCRMFVESIYNI